MRDLCEDFLAAKDRIEAEEAIIDMMNVTKWEGTTTKAIDGFKIAVTTKLTRKLDYDVYKTLDFDFVDMVPKINLTKLREAEKNYPATVADCITSKPAKAAVKVTEVI